MASLLSKDLVVLVACMLEPQAMVALSSCCRQWRTWLMSRASLLHVLNRQIVGFSTLDVPSDVDAAALMRMLVRPQERVALPNGRVTCNVPSWSEYYGPSNIFIPFDLHKVFCTARGSFQDVVVDLVLERPCLCGTHVSLATPGWGFSRPCEDLLIWLRTDRELRDVSPWFGTTSESFETAKIADRPSIAAFRLSSKASRGVFSSIVVERSTVVRAVQVLLLRSDPCNDNIDMHSIQFAGRLAPCDAAKETLQFEQCVSVQEK